jgi:glycerol-3-phosphate acyltransferase PlsY
MIGAWLGPEGWPGGATLGVLIVAFVLGAVPFSFLIAKARGVDIRTMGSGNVGATNLARAAGPALGAVGLLLDAAKGAAAVLLARSVAGNDTGSGVETVAGVLAILGHTFTPFLRFRGGKGVATGAGVFAVLTPGALLVSLAVFLLAAGLSRAVALGSVLGALALPVATHFLGGDRGVVLAAAAAAVLTVVRHRTNLMRLARGTENRFDAGRRA